MTAHFAFKRCSTLLTLGLSLALLLAAGFSSPAQPARAQAAPPSSWNISTVLPGQHIGSLAHHSLKYDAAGQPHLAYTAAGQLVYAHFDGTNWVRTPVDGAQDVGAYAFTLGPDGMPQVAYVDTLTHAVRYAAWDGTRWQTETVGDNGITPGTMYLAVGSDRAPRLVYTESITEAGRLIFAQRDGAAWHTEAVADVESYSSGAGSLVLDAQNRPHVVYNTGVWGTTYAFLTDAGWVKDDIAGCGGLRPDLVLDRTGRPHIMSTSIGNNPFSHFVETPLLYATRAGDSWTCETVTVITGYIADFSLALDQNDRPVVSWVTSGPDGLAADPIYEIGYVSRDTDTWSFHNIRSLSGISQMVTTAPNGNLAVAFLDLTRSAVVLDRVGATGQTTSVIAEDSKRGELATLALDPAGRPAIATLNKLYRSLDYITWNGSTWQAQPVVVTTTMIMGTALGVDRTGRPHLAYSTSFLTVGDIGDGFHMGRFLAGTVTYASTDTRGWTAERVESCYAAPHHEQWVISLIPTLAIDSHNMPRLAYVCDQRRVRYASRAGGTWRLETAADGGVVNDRASLALDANDNPQIAHYEAPEAGLEQSYQWQGRWRSELREPGQAGRLYYPYGQFTALSVEANGTPHIAYYEPVAASNFDTISGTLRYGRWNGTSWITSTVDATPGTGLYASLKLDSHGHPHIAYYDVANNDLKYASWDGTSWQIETLDSEGNVGQYASLQLDAQDQPHIAYYDATHGNLKYATQSTILDVQQLWLPLIRR